MYASSTAVSNGRRGAPAFARSCDAEIATCEVKIWKYDSDIYDPKNWAHKRTGENCDGLVFPSSETPVFVDSLNVKSIVLPRSGIIRFTDEGYIEFDEHSKEEINCATLKHFTSSFWLDPEAWITQGDANNSAIPHSEWAPCEHDDVVFPKGVKSGVASLYGENEWLKVKSFQFGEEKFVTTEQLRGYFRKSYVAEAIFENTMDSIDETELLIDNQGCRDPTGCLCGNENSMYCESIAWRNTDELPCLSPIFPMGFCYQICGARIHFKPKNGFNLNQLKSHLKSYESDTYASKVLRGKDKIIQVVFSEKDYSGNSVDEASDFLEVLKKDYGNYISDLNMTASQQVIQKGLKEFSAISMVFGTLFGAIVIFAVLFFIYSPNIYNRIGLGNRPVSTYLFARYDNIEDRGYILDREGAQVQSVFAPVEKSFENPMFGKTTRSVSESTSEEMIETETLKSGTSSTHENENPLYDIVNQQEKEESKRDTKEEKMSDLWHEQRDQDSAEKEDGYLLKDL